MLYDISAGCINNKTCRYVVKVMHVIRRVMTPFYTLLSPEERNCHNILMVKVYKVVDQPGTSSVLCLTTNWKKCVLCQEDTPEVLRCSASSKRDAEGVGYKTIADNIKGFDKVGCLPMTINLSRSDDGVGIEATFRQHQAKWHDSCRLQFNKTKLERAEKRTFRIEDSTAASKKFTRQSMEEAPPSTETCFFCGMPPVGEMLRNASTFQVDVRVRQCAVKLQDTALLAKLSAGDMIAQEAKYHTQCLVSLYNKAREVATSDQREVDSECHDIAFAGLISYIEEARMDSLVVPVFKLTDLANMYSNRLEQLGNDLAGRVHSTRLKERILAYLPDMEAHKQGREVVLVCN